MKRLDSHFVLGLIILVIGASLAIGLAFDVHSPLVRIAFATVFVALGARMVVHAFRA